MNLESHIADVLARHHLKRTVGVVAVSGGPDSIALAHLLIDALLQGKLERLILAHVNHQLRGNESDADEQFVRELVQPGVSVRTTRIATAAMAENERGNLESIARRERYRFFEQVAREDGAVWVATGHTADDQAETVLFRLLRGSGVLGLSAMSECRPLGETRLIRPLLHARRQCVLDYLHLKQIAYRIDSSNQELHFSRNRLRHELLPLLRAHYNAGINDVLCRLAEQASDLDAIVTEQAITLLRVAERPRAGSILVFAVDALMGVNAHLVREMFRLVWQRESWPMGDMDHERWQRLVEIALGTRAGGDFPGRIHVRRVSGVLQMYSSRSA
jgi:tRNA(Ile)-lysidine synthase